MENLNFGEKGKVHPKYHHSVLCPASSQGLEENNTTEAETS